MLKRGFFSLGALVHSVSEPSKLTAWTVCTDVVVLQNMVRNVMGSQSSFQTAAVDCQSLVP